MNKFELVKEILQKYTDKVDFSESDKRSDTFGLLLSNVKRIGVELSNDELSKMLKPNSDFKNWYQEDLWNYINSSLNKNSSSLIAAPTGFGKSYFIRRIAKHIVNLNTYQRVFIIVPTKELISDYHNEFGEQGINKEDIKEFITKENIKSHRIFILTQERYFNFFRKNDFYINKSDIVIFDEAHKADFLCEKFTKSAANNEIKINGQNNFEREGFLVSSMVIAKQNNCKIFGFMPMFSKKKNNFIFENLNYIFDNLKEIFFDPTSRSIYSFINNGTKISREMTADSAYPSWLSPQEMSINQAINGKCVIYCAKSNIMDLENKDTLLNSIWNLLHEKDHQEIARLEDEINRYYPSLHREDNIYLKSLSKGVGIIIGDTPLFIRKIYKEAYDLGIIKTIFANQTIIEGVNLSPKYLIILNHLTTHNSRFDTSVSNLFGRTGRDSIGKEDGNVLIIGSESPVNKLATNAIQKEELSFDAIDTGHEKRKEMFIKSNQLILEKIHQEIKKPINKEYPDNVVFNALNELEREFSNKKHGDLKFTLKNNLDNEFHVAQEISKELTKFIKENIKSIEEVDSKYYEIVDVIISHIKDKMYIFERAMKNSNQNFINVIDNRNKIKINFVEQMKIDSILKNISEYESDIYDYPIQYSIHDNIINIGRMKKENFINKIRGEIK